MAKITVKLFGVLRIDTHVACEELDVARVADIFGILNKKVDAIYAENKKKDALLKRPEELSFKDAIVFIDGERCSKKKHEFKGGEEVWLLSPASGG